jgi:hypothetical protein
LSAGIAERSSHHDLFFITAHPRLRDLVSGRRIHG